MTALLDPRELLLDERERAAAIQRAAEARYVEIYAPQRAWSFLALTGAFCLGLWGLSFMPAGATLFRVTPARMGLTMLVIFSAIAAATIAARLFGGALGRAHRVAEEIESFVCAAGLASLIHASGSAVSVVWMLSTLHMMNNAQEILGAPAKRNSHAVSLGAVAVAFAFEHKLGDALIVALLDGLLVFLARTQEVVSRGLIDAQVERDELRRRLEEVIAQRERARIARDLHDGVGARLVALAWRADALAAEGPAHEPLRELSVQARTGLLELRQLVRGMKTIEGSLDAFVSSLEADCRSLVPPSCSLRFARHGHGALRHEVYAQLDFVVREGIRNAVQHASPSEINVVFSLDSSFELLIKNDGAPPHKGALAASQGGLSHLTERAAELGATLAMERKDALTILRWQMPRGACVLEPSASAPAEG